MAGTQESLDDLILSTLKVTEILNILLDLKNILRNMLLKKVFLIVNIKTYFLTSNLNLLKDTICKL